MTGDVKNVISAIYQRGADWLVDPKEVYLNAAKGTQSLSQKPALRSIAPTTINPSTTTPTNGPKITPSTKATNKSKPDIKESIPLKPKKSSGEYLYHGTSETALENITKEGLKPGRHTGNISLSPDQTYAQNWSQGGITPQGKTEGVMLRINRDLLKTKILPSKSGVKSDQLNELISKDVIPPEAIEIYKNGKWQPLKPKKSSPLDIWNKANKK